MDTICQKHGPLHITHSQAHTHTHTAHRIATLTVSLDRFWRWKLTTHEKRIFTENKEMATTYLNQHIGVTLAQLGYTSHFCSTRLSTAHLRRTQLERVKITRKNTAQSYDAKVFSIREKDD